MQRTIAEQNASIHRLQHELSNFRKESDIAANNATRYQTKYHNMKSKNKTADSPCDPLGVENPDAVLPLALKDESSDLSALAWDAAAAAPAS